MRVLVGIPAFNVASRLEDVVLRVRRAIPDAAVLVVDDGSTDGTAAVAGRTADEVVRHPANCGYGATQKSIIRFFTESSRYGIGDCLVFVHGDGEMRPEEIPSLVTPLVNRPELDIVIGSRDQRLARRLGFANMGLPRSRWKRVTDRAITGALNGIFGLTMTTFFGGFRAVRRRAFDKLALDELHDWHFFDVQFLTWAGRTLTYLEVPVSNVDNGAISNYSMARAALLIARHAASGMLRPRRIPGTGRPDVGVTGKR